MTHPPTLTLYSEFSDEKRKISTYNMYNIYYRQLNCCMHKDSYRIKLLNVCMGCYYLRARQHDVIYNARLRKVLSSILLLMHGNVSSITFHVVFTMHTHTHMLVHSRDACASFRHSRQVLLKQGYSNPQEDCPSLTDRGCRTQSSPTFSHY